MDNSNDNQKEFTSELTGKSCNYYRLPHLPTHFRSYGDSSEVFVRGLFFDETVAIGSYIPETSAGEEYIPQLSTIYKDVIKGINIDDLEIIDFIFCMIVSSIWTIDGFGWSPNLRCPHIIDGKRCSGTITDKITIDDFDFKEPLVNVGVVPFRLSNTDILIGPARVRDKKDQDTYVMTNPGINPKVVSYATHIHDILDPNGVSTNPTFEDKIKLIRYSYSSELFEYADIVDEFYIRINLIRKKCPKCNQHVDIKLNLHDVRGYP